MGVTLDRPRRLFDDPYFVTKFRKQYIRFFISAKSVARSFCLGDGKHLSSRLKHETTAAAGSRGTDYLRTFYRISENLTSHSGCGWGGSEPLDPRPATPLELIGVLSAIAQRAVSYIRSEATSGWGVTVVRRPYGIHEAAMLRYNKKKCVGCDPYVMKESASIHSPSYMEPTAQCVTQVHSQPHVLRRTINVQCKAWNGLRVFSLL